MAMEYTAWAAPHVLAEVASWRHDLHRHPELAFEEWWTSDFVASQLGQWGLRVHRGLAGTGVVGTLTRGTSRRAIGVRADMDGLAIQEQGIVAHASCTPGVMHACGHDGHVAMALAAARICAQLPNLDGIVHFIFQPAEEGEGGARRMIEEGLFRLFPCDAVYALHNWPDFPVGTCVARDGAMMAALAVFEIVISGEGCHGAMPHYGTDSILAGCHLTSALQSVVSRNIDPLQAAVISTTQIHAGSTWNSIPERCVIRGSARWFEGAAGDSIERRLTALAASISNAFDCKAEVRYEKRFPATINEPTRAAFVRATAGSSTSELSVIDAKPSMSSEDFAFMLEAVPGCYFWLGAANLRNHHGLHSPRYDFNDELLPVGVAMWLSLIQNSLGTG